MSFTAEPTTGKYYRDTDLDEDFMIVEMDEYEGIITIRRGEEIDTVELTLDDWDEMSVEPTDAPAQRQNMETQFSVESGEDIEEPDESVNDDVYNGEE